MATRVSYISEAVFTIIDRNSRVEPGYQIRVQDWETKRWWYVKKNYNGRFEFTSDPLYGKVYTLRRAKQLMTDARYAYCR